MPTGLEMDEFRLEQSKAAALTKIALALPHVVQQLERIADQLEFMNNKDKPTT